MKHYYLYEQVETSSFENKNDMQSQHPEAKSGTRIPGSESQWLNDVATEMRLKEAIADLKTKMIIIGRKIKWDSDTTFTYDDPSSNESFQWKISSLSLDENDNLVVELDSGDGKRGIIKFENWNNNVQTFGDVLFFKDVKFQDAVLSKSKLLVEKDLLPLPDEKSAQLIKKVTKE